MVFFGFEHTIIWCHADSLPTELLAPLFNTFKDALKTNTSGNYHQFSTFRKKNIRYFDWPLYKGHTIGVEGIDDYLTKFVAPLFFKPFQVLKIFLNVSLKK